jgi:hypothetical protein
MNVTTASLKKCAVFAGALAVGVLSNRVARAEVSIIKTDTWELYTTGRVAGFFSYGWGDANVLAEDSTPARTTFRRSVPMECPRWIRERSGACACEADSSRTNWASVYAAR